MYRAGGEQSTAAHPGVTAARFRGMHYPKEALEEGGPTHPPIRCHFSEMYSVETCTIMGPNGGAGGGGTAACMTRPCTRQANQQHSCALFSDITRESEVAHTHTYTVIKNELGF